MKTPAATKATTSAPNSANSTAGDNLTPREARVIDALLASIGWVWREDIDRIAGASNGPHIVMMLRRKVTGDGGGGGGEVNKAPWDPAIKPLQNSLTTGQALENYYQQNPFNPLQQAGYQNLFADLDNFRNVMAPQAMAFNNRMMNTNYQRKPAGTELGGAFTPINASQFLPPEQRQPQGGIVTALSLSVATPVPIAGPPRCWS